MERATPARIIIKAAAVLLAACYLTAGSPVLHSETRNGESSDAALTADAVWKTGISYTAPGNEPSDPMILFIRDTLQNQFSELLEANKKNYLDQDEKKWLVQKNQLQKEYEAVMHMHQRKREADETFFFSRPAAPDAESNSAAPSSPRELTDLDSADEAFPEMLETADYAPVAYRHLEEIVPYGNSEKAVFYAAQYDLDEIIGIELLQLQDQDIFYIHIYGCTYTWNHDASDKIECSFKTYGSAEFSYETAYSLNQLVDDVIASRYAEHAAHADRSMSSAAEPPAEKNGAERKSQAETGSAAGMLIGVYPPPEMTITPFGSGEGLQDAFSEAHADMPQDVYDSKVLLKRSGYQDFTVSLSAEDTETALFFQPSWLSVLNSLDKRQAEFYRRLYTALESLAVTSIVYGLHAEKQTPQVTDLWDISLGFAAGVPVLIAADAALQLAAYMSMNASYEELQYLQK